MLSLAFVLLYFLMELLALILANFSPKIEWHKKRTPGRLKFQSGMEFCFGFTNSTSCFQTSPPTEIMYGGKPSHAESSD